MGVPSETRHRRSPRIKEMRRVAIVGSGPSGFYVAKYLNKARPDVAVDIIDKFPTPFGLVRYGVAPDHPEVKKVSNDFSQVDAKFIGNVEIKNVKKDLDYDAVVLAVGASNERTLGIPGEDLEGVVSARKFVGWYNSEPYHAAPPLSDRAVVIGHGNVGLDCARVLLAPPDSLRHTDINRETLELKKPVTKVSVVGRRGATQAAFTIKELRELAALSDVSIRTEELGDTEASKEELQQMRALKRKRQLIDTFSTESSNCDLRFLLQPVSFEPDPLDSTKLGSVIFEKCRLDGEPFAQKAVGTGQFEEIRAGLALYAVGYLSNLPEPYSHLTKFDKHEAGFVEDNIYCAGWCKRGPSGIIGSNIADAKETVDSILRRLPPIGEGPQERRRGLSEDLLAQATTWADWEKLDSFEKELGRHDGAPRLKVQDPEEMMKIIRKNP